MSGEKNIKASYFEQGGTEHTWSGIPVNTVYRPEDVEKLNYDSKLGDPGVYPFTRGVYKNMYRGRLFSRRLITGCPTASLTNERLKLLVNEGESAINIIGDQPSMIGLDSDHPMAEGAVGCAGVPINTLKDMEVTLEGLPLDQISIMLTLVTPLALPSVLVLAEKQNVSWSSLRGTSPMMGPGLTAPVCMYGGKQWFLSLRANPKAYFEQLKWMAENIPSWNSTNYNSYNIRETGVSAQQEMGFILANVFETFEMALEHDVDLDLVAAKTTLTCSAMIDIFEEAAKFRAARRIWARTLKERFGVKNPKAMRMKVHVNTGGSLMERPQAQINTIRGAYAALGAVLGGIQSMQIASYDEPIAIPTEEAAIMALRTEQILSHETGVTTVVDPLGGSYYVEALTDKMEEEIIKIVDEIEGMGGMTKAVEKGWIDQQIEKEWMRRQHEIENKERIVVGVNEYTVSDEDDAGVPVYQVDRDGVNKMIDEFRKFKKARSQEKVSKALKQCVKVAEKGDENPIPCLIECCKAYATTAEVSGAMRMAKGLDYDPMGILECPF